MLRPTETIVAPATPSGTSAIAVVRATGSDTRQLAQGVFGVTPLPRSATHGNYYDLAGQLVDDVLFTFFQGPHSYTGEDSLEISCHGNPFIVQKILEDLIARGCRSAEPGEFTRRAFLNGRMDLSQAEAVMDLIHARSERALAVANSQLRGALGRRMGGLIDELLGVLAHIEAYIDFPEEDLPIEDRGALITQLKRLSHETNQLIATSHYGELLRDGIKTVIIGAPNAGKSSLLNRLVGRDRALVSPEPGTTRDFLEERIMIGPHCLRLFDTAGINPTSVGLEQLGIIKSYECLAQSDLILLILDSTAPAPTLTPEIEFRLKSSTTVVVLNKSDLHNCNTNLFNYLGIKTVSVSALTGSGFDDLTAEIVKLSDAFQSDVGGDLVAINARHAQALAKSRTALSGALNLLETTGAVELVASELRYALDAYGEISGKIDHERILDQLFSAFCIGK